MQLCGELHAVGALTMGPIG